MKTVPGTKPRIVALAGQPNTGKSTVFNRLTGAKQHVGNWPGKTVEQKSGEFTTGKRRYRVVDLPGTYSLTANSLEEKIARDFIVNSKPDVVVVMADASQLERSLYLLTEVQLLDIPVVLALNMMDVAFGQGKRIDVKGLERKLGVQVVSMTAAKGAGIDELVAAMETAVLEPGLANASRVSMFDADPLFDKIRNIITRQTNITGSPEWLTVKFIEGDAEVVALLHERTTEREWSELISVASGIENGRLHVAGSRYDWIAEVLSATVSRNKGDVNTTRGKRFDRAALHPFWGKVVAVAIMILGFAAAMLVAVPIMGVLKPVTVFLADSVRSVFAGSAPWFGSMLADGLLPGVGVALMMLAYVLAIHIVFALMEDIGYVSRLAFVFDRPMNRIGLHGKSFMPLLMSFGCNIAGVSATRVIDSWQQRMVTLILVSIVPCMALWAVVSFMGTIFFASAMPLVVLSLFAVMVLHISFTSFLLRKFIVIGETSGLIMELPPYHAPNWKTIFGHVWVQVKSFLKRALSLIAILSLVTWALSYRADGNMELSILAMMGKFFDPVTSFLGLDWRLFVALLAAIIAKEASLSVIAVLFGLGNGAVSITSFLFGSSGVEHSVLAGSIAQTVGPASALAFIFAFFFTIPCIGTVATIYSETKSLKWTIGSSLYYVVTSLLAGGLAYRVGLLIF